VYQALPTAELFSPPAFQASSFGCVFFLYPHIARANGAVEAANPESLRPREGVDNERLTSGDSRI